MKKSALVVNFIIMRMNLLKKIIRYRLDKNFLNRHTLMGLKAAAGRQRYIRTENPPPGVTPNREIVILVHGLLHRGMVMNSFARFLASHGYTAIIYDYPTTRYDFFRHAEDFRLFLNRIAEEFPEYQINLVTHSMGGILARIALAQEKKHPPRERFNRIVMLAPPHRGSESARRIMEICPRTANRLVKPLRGLSNDANSPVHSLPWPENYETGVIAGSYDRYVTLDSAKVPDAGDFIILPCGHSFMMFNPEVHRQTLAFLKNGSFNHNSLQPQNKDALQL